MQEISSIETQQVGGAGGKLDPGGFGDAVPPSLDAAGVLEVSRAGGKLDPGGYGD